MIAFGPADVLAASAKATAQFIDLCGAPFSSPDEMFLIEVHSDVYPNETIIDEWKVSCNVDPDVEIDAALRYADDWIGLSNATDFDETDITNGTSSEDTDANINNGSAISA